MMKKLVFIFVFLLLTGCISKATGNHTPEAANDRSTPVPLRAVYLTQQQAQLSAGDLQAHPEIVVVQTFDEFKQYASQKIALWVDKSATPFTPEQEKWINEAPQAYFPIVLVGYSDTLYSFRDLLGLCCFMGPPMDRKLEPGFSVIQREETSDPITPAVTFLQGYNQKPTVPSILEITNVLLEGRLKAAPTATFLPIATSITPNTTEVPELSTSVSGTSQVLLIDESHKDGFPTDAAKITAITLEKNILKINVTYQGGCQEHIFELHAETAFLQSNPPQGVFYLSHDAQGDTCAENVEKLLSFDLTPLNQERNDPSERPLLLRIYEPAGGSLAREPYMPLIEWP
ncbi:MAG TPA: NigD-like C-terminal domain-containing protein [Anaerolineales bacterium]|nr:NigD-like C-terminal domain-containing protein [Anaerolineales bacterium]